jgi:hypothetical protein
MIDERVLADPTTCPSCGGRLGRVTSCPTCGVDLSGAAAARVWQLSVQAAQLLAERRRLLDQLREQPRTPLTPVAPVGARRADLPAPRRPAPEWSRRRVQTLLLWLGVGLLAVAAVIFLVVSWSVLSLGGRAAVMAGCTVLAGTGAAVAQRRGLAASAEAVSLLCVALALLDAWGARHAGLAGLQRADALVYWAGALGAVAAVAAATAAVVPTRALRLPAATLVQLPVPLLALHLADGSRTPAAVVAAGLTLQALAALGVAAAGPRSARRDARLVLAAGGALSWFAAIGAATLAAYAEAGALVAGTAVLVVLAAVAAVAAGRLAGPLSGLAGASSALLVVAAAWAPLVEGVGARWRPVALAAVVVALLVAAVVVPARHRRAPEAAVLATVLVPLAAMLQPLAVLTAGHLGWLDRAWAAHGDGPALSRLDALSHRDLGLASGWGAETPLVPLAVAAAFAVVALRHRRLLPGGARGPVALAGPLVGAAVLLVPVAVGATYGAALVTDLATGAALLGLGVELWRRAQRAAGAVWLAVGAAVLGLTSAWAFASESATLLVLPVVAALLTTAAARAGGATASAAPRLPLAGGAALTALAWAAALARSGGAGWPAVTSLVLSLSGVLAAVVAARVPGRLRRALLVTGTVAVLADAVALTAWAGGSVADTGLSLTMAATVVAAAALRPDLCAPVRWLLPGPAGRDVAMTAVGGAATGIALTVSDGDRLWLALLAAGVGAAAVALRPSLHAVGWLAGGLLTASSWARLALSDVDAPEPYTVPAGVALILLGALRRRRDPAHPSWRAYGSGLVLALVPSLIRAVTDAGTGRPALLGLVALAVLVAGVARRLQAPLVLGGTVLAVDALVQLSPYLLAVYDAVPRWTLFATAGLLLLGIGTTYERRAREVRALRQQVSRLG